MTRIGLWGGAGRMGQAVAAAISQAEDLTLACAVEAAGHPALGRPVGPDGQGPALASAPAGDPDVFIEFAGAAGLAACREWCCRAGTPLVSGSTGLSGADRQALEGAAAKIPVLAAANMSLGINLLLQLVPRFREALGPDYDCEIVEIHHNQKRDAPSGTALALAAALDPEESLARVPGRQGLTGPRPRGEIGLHAVRGGDVTGDHLVLFAGPGERLELVHRAHRRQAFAGGALRAARFLLGKKPGRYTMAQVLGL